MDIKKPIKPGLIVMAAGMGSRYGGLKQMDPVTDAGEVIIDFSLYDAMLAGFEKVVFVIRDFMESDLRAMMDDRAGKHMELSYAIQKVEDLPAGYEVPEGREKPWGTGHAIMAARDAGFESFAVINADDYYGAAGFQLIYDFLTYKTDANSFCMAGYRLQNTVSENGYVNRGVCRVNEDGFLEDIVEREKIQWVEDKICYPDAAGNWQPLPKDTPVSMNFWGFGKLMMEELIARFPSFLNQALAEDPLGAEYYLPKVADELIREGVADVKVLTSPDRWYGVTYKEDKETVTRALQSMKDKGLYPEKLWR